MTSAEMMSCVIAIGNLVAPFIYWHEKEFIEWLGDEAGNYPGPM